jgi:hypothetical protein
MPIQINREVILSKPEADYLLVLLDRQEKGIKHYLKQNINLEVDKCDSFIERYNDEKKMINSTRDMIRMAFNKE